MCREDQGVHLSKCGSVAGGKCNRIRGISYVNMETRISCFRTRTRTQTHARMFFRPVLEVRGTTKMLCTCVGVCVCSRACTRARVCVYTHTTLGSLYRHRYLSPRLPLSFPPLISLPPPFLLSLSLPLFCPSPSLPSSLCPPHLIR